METEQQTVLMLSLVSAVTRPLNDIATSYVWMIKSILQEVSRKDYFQWYFQPALTCVLDVDLLQHRGERVVSFWNGFLERKLTNVDMTYMTEMQWSYYFSKFPLLQTSKNDDKMIKMNAKLLASRQNSGYFQLFWFCNTKWRESGRIIREQTSLFVMEEVHPKMK